MRIYHGSLEIVETPEIRIPERQLDYGCGFYTTTSYEQAEKWVKNRMRDTHSKKGYVNTYEFDEVGSRVLKRLIFDFPTDEWIDFVMANRLKDGFTHNNDIVYGPVANDRVYTSFILYEGDIIGKDELKKRLKTYKLVDQYLFHTKESLRFLNYLESKEITL